MLRTFTDAAELLRAVGPSLAEREAEHHLLLGVATALKASGPSASSGAFLAAVTDAAGLAMASVMAPSRPLLLASDREEVAPALEALWDALAGGGHMPRRIVADVRHARAFAEGWGRRTGCAMRLHMRQRLHVLTEVRPRPPATGELRRAAPPDLLLVGDWMIAFDREALGEMTEAQARAAAERRIGAGEIFLWVDDGAPRSMAGCARPTTHGIAINAVYTPPEWRGRGYATAAVAQLSAQLLDDGRAFCVLYTDLANPTSNGIYARIGYRGVRDFDVYELMG